MTRKMVSILVAGIAMFGAVSPADAKWLRADTGNFIIYSEGNEKSLRDFAVTLERFDMTLRLRFKQSGERDPNRLTIYLVKHADDAGALMTGKSGSMIAGFYTPHPEGSYAVSNRDSNFIQGTSEAQQTLFHEYSHHFMMRYLPAAFPAWFVEGFAEYLSTVDFTADGKAKIGNPPQQRAYSLLRTPEIPAETLLFQRPGELRDAAKIDGYYGRSWLLTHMLFSDPARDGQLSAYIDAINSGVDPKEAATKAFSDLKQLDRDLNRYMSRRLSVRLTNDPVPVAGEVAITPLSAAADAMLPLQLERKSAKDDPERLAPVRDALAKLTVQYPSDAGIWYEFAMAEWGMGKEKRDAAAARDAVDKALAIAPQHVGANLLLGRMMLADLAEKDDVSAADWNAARKPIIRANRADPDDPAPLFAYYRSFADEGVAPPPVAVDGLAHAFELAPENMQTRISYAYALAAQGQVDTAIRLAKVVAFDPHDRGDGLGLLEQLEAMRRGGRKDAPASAEPADDGQ
ncbi:hypothetical protein [Sphingopyxis sp. 550A]